MRTQTLLVCAALSTSLSSAAEPDGRPALPTERPGSALPVIHEHSYTMAGRVRLLVMWIGRDNVGGAVIRWRGEGDTAAFELLIGSDPLRAPAKLNRWGYIAEEVHGAQAEVVGVMSKSDESSASEVQDNQRASSTSRPFQTIRARVTPQASFARIVTVQAPTAATYREADQVLALTLGGGAEANRRIERPRGARPGFLSSVAELVHKTVTYAIQGQPFDAESVPYVYGGRLYELRLLGATRLDRFEHHGRIFEHVVRGRFETGSLG